MGPSEWATRWNSARVCHSNSGPVLMQQLWAFSKIHPPIANSIIFITCNKALNPRKQNGAIHFFLPESLHVHRSISLELLAVCIDGKCKLCRCLRFFSSHHTYSLLPGDLFIPSHYHSTCLITKSFTRKSADAAVGFSRDQCVRKSKLFSGSCRSVSINAISKEHQ